MAENAAVTCNASAPTKSERVTSRPLGDAYVAVLCRTHPSSLITASVSLGKGA
jgi:hypothetical protein